MEIALNEHEPYLASASVFPAYDPLRSDERFVRLLEQIGPPLQCAGVDQVGSGDAPIAIRPDKRPIATRAKPGKDQVAGAGPREHLG